jgi:hypothetical protein
MASLLRAEFQQYLEMVGTSGIWGPPFWVGIWVRPTTVGPGQTVFYLGSSRSPFSFYSLEIRSGGEVAVVSASPFSGQAEAVVSRAVEPGRWYAVVACWRAADRRSLHLPQAMAMDTSTVTVPYVDRVAIGRRASVAPSGYLDGAVAWLTMGTGVPSDRQIGAMLRGMDPRLVFPRSQLRALFPLHQGGGDLLGPGRLVCYGEIRWVPQPGLIGPRGSFLQVEEWVAGAGEWTFAHVEAGRVAAGGSVSGQIAVPGSRCGLAWA